MQHTKLDKRNWDLCAAAYGITLVDDPGVWTGKGTPCYYIIDSVRYDTSHKAMKKYGIDLGKLHTRCKSPGPKWKTWERHEYKF